MDKKELYLCILLAGFVLIAPIVAEGEETLETSVLHKHTNRLVNESSPYLLQHAHNPVDWYPWSKEAFNTAKKLEKPVFLSIGYSTCHWCHVMERESFTSERIAKILNEHFISIKVDREQRPDIDEIYMNAVQMMTGSGGWPLSVFLTPEGEPFYGGTYFPPEDMFGRPSFERVLLTVADAWKNKRGDLLESAGKISAVLENLSEQPGGENLSPERLKDAYSYLEDNFDSVNGGFGAAPKFPQPNWLTFLLGYWHRTADAKALEMVEVTLDVMSKGGIYDHLGGGFHRYSTDAQWLVPHFEKMLYDQALLSRAYIQAYQATGKEYYAEVARETFDYVLRDMTDPKGGFYSAEDADSEGKEGLFYVWQLKEIKQVLGAENAKIFNAYYGVTERGNFEDGRNILNITESAEESEQASKILAESSLKLLEHRSKRVRPHRDDKIITGWNGLMISSMAYGGTVLQELGYVSAAEKAAEFVLKDLREDGRLKRYYRDGRAVGLGFLDDYAFMITALLDLYEATFDAKWLVEADELAEQMIELFRDEQDGGFFMTGADAEKLIVRSKPAYDGAVPSGNSVAALAMLKLGRLTMNQRFNDTAEQLLRAFSSRIQKSPASLNAMLIAFDFWIGPVREMVIAGDLQRPDTKEMLKLIRSRFLPNTVILFHETGQAGEAIEKVALFLKDQVAIDGKVTAYVCENYVCKKPVNEINALEALLLSKN